MPQPETTRAPAGSGPSGGNRDFHGWRIVAALAVTQTVGYGALYYAFAVLLRPMSADLHASTTTVTGALTAATLAGAVMAVPVGRWLDRRGGRGLMTLGSVLAAALLVAWSQVRTVDQLYAALVGVGLASAMVLYEPAFAVVVAWFDPARRANALLAITVVAGFASSIFMPLTGLLVDRYGWRDALLILAAMYGVVTVPLHAAVLRRPSASGRAPEGVSVGPGRDQAIRVAIHDPRFWILAVVFVANSAAISALTVHLVAYLIVCGHSATFAATVAGLLGVLSVTGRLALTGAQRRARPGTAVAIIFGVQAIAAASLPVVGPSPTGAVIAVIGFGLGFGAATIARPALLADRYGATGYATISGLLTVPITVAKAGAPLTAAALLHLNGNYTPIWVAVGICCAIAAVGVLAGAGPRALPVGDCRTRPRATPPGTPTRIPR